MARFLSIKTVASKLDVSTVTIRRWVASGAFPPPVVMPGGDHRWHEYIVDVWMGQRPSETPPTEEAVKSKAK